MPLPADVVDRLLDPAGALLVKEESEARAERLRRHLTAAGPAVRRAWRLCVVRGLPYAEVANLLGIPGGTVASWIHRARRARDGMA